MTQDKTKIDSTVLLTVLFFCLDDSFKFAF